MDTRGSQPSILNQCATIVLLLLSTQPSLADEISSIGDKLAIGEQLAQYSYRWDSKDANGFVELFTEDAILERWRNGALVTNSRLVGKQAIYNYALESHRGRLADRQSRHHISGLVFLELNENSAVTENMALITHQTADSGPAFISSSGIYRNTWRRTDSGWKIAKRVLYADSFDGSKAN